MGTALDGNTVVVATDQQASADVQDEAVILHDGKYYGLNAVGARVWKLIQEPMTVDRIVEGVVEQYDVDRQRCSEDVYELLRDLIGKGLAEVKRDGTST